MVDDASALVVIEPAMGIPMAARADGRGRMVNGRGRMVEAGWSMVEAAQPDPCHPPPGSIQQVAVTVSYKF
jgi:hypothetical protein